MKKLIASSAAIALFGFAGSAQADTFTVDINTEWATSATGFVVDMPLGPIGMTDIASIKSITLEVAHTWSSDLVINLAFPGNSIVLANAQGGDGCGVFDPGDCDLGVVAGDGSLANVFAYTFVETGVTAAWGAGVSDGTPFTSATWAAGPLTNVGWVLQVQDLVGGDGGAIGTLTIEYNPVPLPAAAWLLISALGGLGFMRRR